MSEVKQRKNRSAFTKKSRAPPDHNVSGDKTAITKPAKKGKCPTNFVEATESVLNMHLSKINLACGLLIMLFIGYKYALYTKTLHENDMWFSNIREVEREISFRTESGLYYSYYKQFVNAPSVKQGWYELTHDNITEHLNTINVLERMNIYQEVLLGLLYRSLPVKNVEPVYFYINSIFALQGMLLCALYVTAWLLSGSWLAGALATAFYILNKADTTRVELAIPLRESFSLPFLWVEVAAATYYLRPGLSLSKERLVLCLLTLSTFCMAVTWQFNQFVLLLQGLALYGVWLLDMLPGYKVRRMLGVIAFSLLGTCILQYVNTMILCSLVLSLILSTLLLMYITGDQPRQCSITTRIASLFLKLVFTAVSTVTINKAIKIILQEEADEHIYKFVQNKFGFGFSRDFDVRMYLCNGAFQFLPMDTYVRLTERFVFPTYVIVTIVLLGCLVTALIQHWWPPGHKVPAEDKQKAEEGQSPLTATHLLANRPELAYHLAQSILFGVMAVMVLRMKYLWTPYMCILASWGISDYQTWKFVLAKLNIRREIFVQCIRHVSTCTMLAVLLAVSLPSVWKELEDLREFYDPDTVDLMEWVKKSVPREAAFTGSMQLLAGVKLCTERHITNHPHYEDKGLRMRTKELYQMYGRRTPEDVWTIMKKYNASYIILEDSICMAPSDDCRTPDIIDMDNGVIPDHGNFSPGLVPSKVPRFCDEIRYGRPAYTKYFKKVFVNRTFRVYQVLT